VPGKKRFQAKVAAEDENGRKPPNPSSNPFEFSQADSEDEGNELRLRMDMTILTF
jgi:hypothetical protein